MVFSTAESSIMLRLNFGCERRRSGNGKGWWLQRHQNRNF